MRRFVYLGMGWVCVALGFAGVWVPLLPTTIFLIIAAWAFARSSPELRQWLLTHPRFGPSLTNWFDHGMISPRAKASAATLMAVSYVILWLTSDIGMIGLASVGAILAACAAFVLTRPQPEISGAADGKDHDSDR